MELVELSSSKDDSCAHAPRMTKNNETYHELNTVIYYWCSLIS
jgi:hypothetical protein